MLKVNCVHISGCLTDEPKARLKENKITNCIFRLASNDRYNKTCFIDVVCFYKMADLASNYLQKGSQVFVEGKLQQNDFKDKEGNVKRGYEIVANQIHFIKNIKSKEEVAGGE